jgi:hypothetical protein
VKGEAGLFICSTLLNALGGQLDLLMQDGTRQTNAATHITQRNTTHRTTSHQSKTHQQDKTKQHTAPADKTRDQMKYNTKNKTAHKTHLKTTERDAKQDNTRKDKTRQGMNNPQP